MARRSKEQPSAEEFEPGMVEFIELAHEDPAEEADTRWLIQHYSDLVREYPMSWVAIQDQQVVGHGATPNRAMETAMQALRARGEDPTQDDEYHAASGRETRKNVPHLYFLERSADWIREH